jgi:large subunit ribosomal protein L24
MAKRMTGGPKEKKAKKMRVIKGDLVKVVTGNDKGMQGKVLKTFPDTQRVIVEKVNMIKRHTRPTQRLPQGGVIEREAPIHVSNVMVIDPKTGVRTRVGYKVLSDGTRERIAKKSGEMLPRHEH